MAPSIFTITARDSESKARSCILHTKSGGIETPFFMPVATKSAVKHIASGDLEEMQARAIICNALVLGMRPGARSVGTVGGIAKFMAFPGIVFTDSGGFQMYSSRLYVGAKENGVRFRNPYTGEQIFMTPEADMELQLALNSDVALCLDSMPLLSVQKNEVAEAVRKTTAWAERCKKHHDAKQIALPKEKRQLLFGIVQGGVHKDLREESAKQLVALDFEGYALGGLALGEPKEQEYEMIDVAKSLIPEHKPVYLMGAGNPLELIEAIARGCDCFDSRYPTQNARRGTLFTRAGFLKIANAPYKEDTKSIDPACQCFVCRRYSRAYIRHLLRNDEGVGYRLASFHNLFFLQELMRRARAAIAAGSFKTLQAEMRQAYGS